MQYLPFKWQCNDFNLILIWQFLTVIFLRKIDFLCTGFYMMGTLVIKGLTLKAPLILNMKFLFDPVSHFSVKVKNMFN